MKIEELQQWIKENLFKNNKLVGKRITKKWFNKHHFSKYILILKYTSFLNKINPSLNQRIYHIYYNLFYIPLCKECNIKYINYTGFNNGYGFYCSKKCTNIMRNRKAHKNNEDWSIVREKAKQTCLEKYGNPYYNNSEKTKKTCLEKYGVENAQKCSEISKKRKETNLKIYGYINPLNNKTVRAKADETSIREYGVDNPFKSPDFQNLMKEERYKKYGVYYDSQKHIHHIENLNKEFVQTNFIGENKCFLLNEFQKYFNMSRSHSFLKLKNLGIDYKKYKSIGEQEIFEYIKKLNIDVKINRRDIISPYEIDIYIPEYNLAIEYNGMWYHCEQIRSDKKFHLMKTEMCNEENIQLLHIFGHQWQDYFKNDVIKSMICNKLNKNDKIYARNCDIRYVDHTTKNDFLNNNHIQGQCQSSINIGLYYNNELVSIMTFSKSRFNKKYTWELLRFCNKKYMTVIGSASKLLKRFIKKYGKSIITYADRTYSNGNLYETIGFEKIKINDPSYFYYKHGTTKVLNRLWCQKKNLKKLLSNYNSELTEWQNMLQNGYDRYWDCGSIVYKYE